MDVSKLNAALEGAENMAGALRDAARALRTAKLEGGGEAAARLLEEAAGELGTGAFLSAVVTLLGAVEKITDMCLPIDASHASAKFQAQCAVVAQLQAAFALQLVDAVTGAAERAS